MTEYFARHLVAAPGDGLSLDTKVELIAHPPFMKEGERILAQISEVIADTGRTYNDFQIVGFYSKRKPVVLNGKNSTKVHEESHQWLDELWPQAEDSFDESLAYATADCLCNLNELARRRRSLSLRLGRYHQRFVRKALNGGLKEDDREEMKRLVDDGNNHSSHNWAAFSELVEQLRFYAIFHDIWRKFPEKTAREKIKRGVRLSRYNGLKTGMRYLANQAGIDAVFVEENRFYRTDNRETIFTTNLICDPGYNDYIVSGSFPQEIPLTVKVFSKEFGIYHFAKQALGRWEDLFAESVDEEFKITTAGPESVQTGLRIP